MYRCISVLTALCLTLSCAAAAQALQVRSDTALVVPEDAIIDDDLIAFGQTVEIAGTVTGNLIAWAQHVEITGKVGGSVVAAGQTVESTGPIAGSLQAAGQSVLVDAPIGRNFMGAGATVRLGERGVVGRDALAAGAQVKTAGIIGGDLKAAGSAVTATGDVRGDGRFWTDQLRLSDDARFGGDVTYVGQRVAEVAEGAQVAGRLIHRLPKPPVREAKSPWPWRMVRLVWMVLFAAAAAALLPRHISSAAERIRTATGWTALVGVIALVVTPGVALMLLIPMLPAALMILGVYAACLYVATVVAGVFVGGSILGRLGGRRPVHPVLAGMLGVVIIWALGLLPFMVGLVVRLAALIFGFGGLGMLIGRVIADSRLRPTPEG